MLTTVCRPTLPTAPGFLIEAATAGTGKTLLASAIAELVDPAPSAVTYSDDDEEMGKKLLTFLREGRRTLLLDNISGVFHSAKFDAFMTTSIYSDRILGANVSGAYRTNVMVFLTANNVIIGGDSWRRLLTCRIVSPVADPEKQVFPFHPVQYVRRHRMELVHAALTILRAYVAAGSPRVRDDAVGSFEAWDARVGQAVAWIVKQDNELQQVLVSDDPRFGCPVACIAERKQQDERGVLYGEFLKRVVAVFGHDDWTVAELVSGGRAADSAGPIITGALPATQEWMLAGDPAAKARAWDRMSLEGTLARIPRAKEREDRLDNVRIGYWVKGLRDNVSDVGLVLRQCEHTRNGAKVYRVEEARK